MFRSSPTSVGNVLVPTSLRGKGTPQSDVPCGFEGAGNTRLDAGLGVCGTAPADVGDVNHGMLCAATPRMHTGDVDDAISVALTCSLLSDGLPSGAEVYSTTDRAEACASTSVHRKMRLVADAPGLDLDTRSDIDVISTRRREWWEQLCFYMRLLDHNTLWAATPRTLEPTVSNGQLLRQCDSSDVSDAVVDGLLDSVVRFPFELVSFDLDWRAALHTIRFRDTLTNSDIKIRFTVVRNCVPESNDEVRFNLDVDFMAVMNWVKRFSAREGQIILEKLKWILPQETARQMVTSRYPMFDTKCISSSLRLVEIVFEHPLSGISLIDTGNARNFCRSSRRKS